MEACDELHLWIHDPDAIRPEHPDAGTPRDLDELPLRLDVFRDRSFGEPGGEHHNAFDIAALLGLLHHA